MSPRVKQGDEAPTPFAEPVERIKQPNPDVSSKPILAIDCNSATLPLYTIILNRAGFSVKTSTDAVEGLDILKREEFALLILEIMLPGMDGFEVLEHIRADPRWDAMPIVMCSARADKEAPSRALALGADAYVTKPFLPTDIIEQVQTLLINGRKKPTETLKTSRRAGRKKAKPSRKAH